MSNNKKSSVEWLCEKLALKLGVPMAISFYIDHAEEIEQAKAMHKKEIDNLSIHIHEGIENTLVYIEDGIIHVKPNTKTQ